MATTEDLRRRWFDRDGLALTQAVRSWLTGRAARPGVLAEVDGRTDLRGIPLTSLPTTVGDPRDASAGLTWEALDLRGAALEDLRFHGGRVADCRFDGASLFHAAFSGAEVVDCSFVRADLRTRSLTQGVWLGRRTTFRRVSFDRANLRQTSITAAVLDGCTFHDTSNRLFLVDCEARGSVVTGTSRTLVIDGRGHRHPVDPDALDLDLSRTTLTDFSLEGYRLRPGQLPAQDDLVVVRHYPSVLRAASEWLRRPEATEAQRRRAGLFDYTLGAPGAEDSDFAVTLGGYGDPETAAVVRAALEHGARA